MIPKKVAAGIALAAALPLTLTACGGGGGSEEGSGSAATEQVSSLSILDYYNNDPDKHLVQKGLDVCAKQLSITINRETVPGDTLIAKVLQQASSKTLPDVLMLDNPDIQQIAATGALAPLGEYGITGEGIQEGVVQAATYEGGLYGLQPVTNTIAIFYNKKILDEAGIKPPTTWAELKDSAKKLTKGQQYGFAFDATADYEGAWQFLPAMWTNGGDETALTTPEVAEALQLWKDLVDSGASSKSVVTWSQGDVADQFKAGRAAMMLNGPWNIPSLSEEKSLEWGVVTFPVNKDGQQSVAPLGGEAWTVPLTGDEAKQAKAAEFVKCLNSDEVALQFAKDRYVVPTNLELAKTYAQEVPEMAAFAQQVATARSRTGQLGDKWPDTAKVIYTGVQLTLTGQAAPADAMAKAGAQ
ncbi:putative sugar ABC transporter substrate-binding protein [Microlunatus phosphovorus NM-1]|uniref:Putative sugar ABC transporter substrate-binding protein n=1 Tax=Microlunatus phosphovorus (strain ATCC 700054 / DSM 10555 / JCM 9379 / NBRC 101784 / NCIMB 13414 / VKM Ac-1990 / NM-1) TaxID=1032480 RepID=F5XF38_MICPN|nr:extracellular solute-binding protein [Microlunatus phosphovorus]BAK37776.1 putative sugar ABC transporter substrate-binding protein [Microlunatus phosphovorus NM-1]